MSGISNSIQSVKYEVSAVVVKLTNASFSGVPMIVRYKREWTPIQDVRRKNGLFCSARTYIQLFLV